MLRFFASRMGLMKISHAVAGNSDQPLPVDRGTGGKGKSVSNTLDSRTSRNIRRRAALFRERARRRRAAHLELRRGTACNDMAGTPDQKVRGLCRGPGGYENSQLAHQRRRLDRKEGGWPVNCRMAGMGPVSTRRREAGAPVAALRGRRKTVRQISIRCGHARDHRKGNRLQRAA